MATTTLQPAGDVNFSNTYWSATGGDVSWWDQIVPHVNGWDDAANDATYISTNSFGQAATITLGNTPLNTSEVSEINLRLRARIIDVSGNAVVEFSLRDSADAAIGATQDLAGGDLSGGYGQIGNYDAASTAPLYWDLTGNELSKSQADGIKVEMVFAAAT